MDASLFSQINTAISVREARMVTKEQFDQLLTADDRDRLVIALQDTDYQLDKETLADPNAIEDVLMKHLAEEYRFAFEETPVEEIVQLFALRYTYHNLKVLLKARATGQELNGLLLPIGRYSKDILDHLVTTLTSEVCPEVMVEEVAATWSDYQDYRDIRVLDIGMDMAYFKHLNALAEQIDVPELTAYVALTVDFYNVITVKRGLNLEKPRSFMRQLLSEDAMLKAREYLKLYEEGSLLSWFNQLYPNSMDPATKPYETRLAQSDISAVELEYLMDVLRFQVLDQGRFETQGPLPLARYIWGKELEVKNLRLILTGRSNELDSELLKERMRPVYGQ
ncbi:V-type ATPase subunit [Streptococcus moroccensis]|uniref:V/A-type H+-transporting ATPase subunit C n=1 Tax=Streptococcus moroccensis TaxID=1451356 RepID=A0ABT9YTR2_9STRE|nr:V-type ATPase subunit [Streptococcus moroccensis]MDQ0223292.1 V/A-type H+-transporting ATPase subunit C [Streptococcus moroccensis]